MSPPWRLVSMEMPRGYCCSILSDVQLRHGAMSGRICCDRCGDGNDAFQAKMVESCLDWNRKT